jgi:hypothetical protein
MHERLRAGLATASAELKANLASFEYAFAMGCGRDGGRDHPLHAATHARTEMLTSRYRDARARLREHEL